MHYYKISIRELLSVAPILVEYLILETPHFCLRDFNRITVSKLSPHHVFLDVTFIVNDLKSQAFKPHIKVFDITSINDMYNLNDIDEESSSSKVSAFAFELNRIFSKYIQCKNECKRIIEFNPSDDYGRPTGDERIDYEKSSHWRDEYFNLTQEYISYMDNFGVVVPQSIKDHFQL